MNELVFKKYDTDKRPVYEKLLRDFNNEEIDSFEYRVTEKTFLYAKINFLLGNVDRAAEVISSDFKTRFGLKLAESKPSYFVCLDSSSHF